MFSLGGTKSLSQHLNWKDLEMGICVVKHVPETGSFRCFHSSGVTCLTVNSTSVYCMIINSCSSVSWLVKWRCTELYDDPTLCVAWLFNFKNKAYKV